MVDDNQTDSDNTVQADADVPTKNLNTEQPLPVQNPINDNPISPITPYMSAIGTNTNPQLAYSGPSDKKRTRWSRILLNIAIFLVIPMVALLIGTFINPNGMLSFDFTSKNVGILDFIVYFPFAIYFAAILSFTSINNLGSLSNDVLTNPNIFMIITLIAPIILILSILAFIFVVRYKHHIPKKSFLILEIIWSIILLIMTVSAPSRSEGSEG